MADKKKSMNLDFTHRQRQAFDHLTNDKKCAVLFGGAKGGGKSYLLCLWSLYYVNQLCRKFDLPITDKPLAVGFIGRKYATHFNMTTMETWKRNVPGHVYTIAEQKKEIILWGRAKILYGGLDNQEDIEKFNSAEFAFMAIDQAEETEKTDVAVLQASLRLTYNGIVPAYKELYTANPGDCWLKTDFVDGARADGVFVPALPSDNPYLPEGYVQTLEQSFKHDPELLLAYRDGNWDIMQRSKTVFTRTILEALRGVEIVEPKFKKFISVDPATGGDECVIMRWENTKVVETVILHLDNTMLIAGEVIALAKRNGVMTVAIDVIGIGKGIYDRIREQEPEWRIMPIQSAEKATSEQFKNVRAEMWFNARELALKRKIAYPGDEELVRQLTSPRYSVVDSKGCMQLERKDITKARLGRSPDRADCWIYGIYAYLHATDLIQTTKKDDYGRKPRESLGYLSA